jgi:antitoxin component HigA of HigAB toxin-antitoxin module
MSEKKQVSSMKDPTGSSRVIATIRSRAQHLTTNQAKELHTAL